MSRRSKAERNVRILAPRRVYFGVAKPRKSTVIHQWVYIRRGATICTSREYHNAGLCAAAARTFATDLEEISLEVSVTGEDE